MNFPLNLPTQKVLEIAYELLPNHYNYIYLKANSMKKEDWEKDLTVLYFCERAKITPKELRLTLQQDKTNWNKEKKAKGL